ncbi:MAG: hypothetical protein GX616_16170 [Planctomycetes bacterium]|nr:hypothetical protein [Planctomycetota bacterium]
MYIQAPVIRTHQPSDGRDPSAAQIRRRCEAILRCYPRPKVGSSDDHRWHVPVVAAPPDFDVERVA